MIQDMVKRLDEKGWVFTYIGAIQDAMMEAGKLGIRNSLNFDADEEGTKRMWMKEKESRQIFYSKACGDTSSSEDLKENYFAKGEFDDWK